MNSGDTAWVLVCTALVLLMTPGLALFYGGLVRQRNVVNTIKMSFIALGLIALEWVFIGYSMAFSPGNGLLGGIEWFGLTGVGAEPNSTYAEGIPHLVFMAFQMMFAIIAPALISGAVVGRMKFRAYAAFILLWGLVVYNPLAHWVWGSGGWLGELGSLDFAGGAVVHISAGVSALVVAMILGPRRALKHGSEDRPHNIPIVVLGTALLWFGWIGFNAGSALAADGIAAVALVTTVLSASTAVVAWVGLDMLRGRKPTVVGASIAAVVGLVTITPAAGFVTPMAAILFGAVGAMVSYGAMAWMRRSPLDDTLDVFACHGLGGITGAILTGFFATLTVNSGGANGLFYGNPTLLAAQVISVGTSVVFAGLGTALILGALRLFMDIRSTRDEEFKGVDLSEHAEAAYSLDTLILRPEVTATATGEAGQ